MKILMTGSYDICTYCCFMFLMSFKKKTQHHNNLSLIVCPEQIEHKETITKLMYPSVLHHLKARN
ncbi:hypothetical protein ACMD2_18242 [Ananas comosus]|uniref:Uncharacterized protein n=1 Tax=Ananas comosus TaxID=4615 RepID=A0A199VKF1_ANACO|nr:hypothetical protein ACMD2_18242 [Ananas comosus]